MRPYKCHLSTDAKSEMEMRSGLKTLDARVQSGYTEGLAVGDMIRFNSVRVRVLGIRRYPSFGDLLAHEDYKKLMPDAQSQEEVLETIRGANPVDERNLGVEAIEFEVEV